MKTFVPQKPANARAIATTIDFGAASAEVLPLPGVYTFRLESVRVPSRLKLSSIGAPSASSTSSRATASTTASTRPATPSRSPTTAILFDATIRAVRRRSACSSGGSGRTHRRWARS